MLAPVMGAPRSQPHVDPKEAVVSFVVAAIVARARPDATPADPAPVTDEDEQNIRTAVAMLEEWMIQQLDPRNQSSWTSGAAGNTSANPTVPAPMPVTRPAKKKSKNGRRRPKVAA